MPWLWNPGYHKCYKFKTQAHLLHMWLFCACFPGLWGIVTEFFLVICLILLYPGYNIKSLLYCLIWWKWHAEFILINRGLMSNVPPALKMWNQMKFWCAITGNYENTPNIWTTHFQKLFSLHIGGGWCVVF